MKDGHEEALGQVVQVLRQIVQNFERLQKGSAKLVPETRWSDSETSQSSESNCQVQKFEIRLDFT